MSGASIVTTEQLARVLAALPGEPRVVASGNFVTPRRSLAALDSAIEKYHLYMLNPQRGLPDREGVTYETSFIGPGMRNSPRLDYYPCRLSLVPHLLRTTLQPDVVLVHTSLPQGGALSLGVEVNILPAAIAAARVRGGVVIAEANASMPMTYGDALIPMDAFDYIVEVDEPLTSMEPTKPDDISTTIGDRVAELVPQGATLQVGIGSIPDATLGALTQHRDLRVWSEMIGDGVLALEQAGCLDQETPITSSFCFGSPELYDWVDRNPRVRMLRTEKTNDPGLIATHQRLVSVNSALQVDLFAQANACRIGTRVYSGYGGQTDFIVGALHSPGGRAIIALRSWHPKADVSAVVPLLTGPVTSFQHSFIVTEQGAAEIWGRESSAQAQQILDNVAHPSVRDELRDGGRRLGLDLH